MEKRKLVRLGKSSLVVSLPKEWIKANKLSAGEEVAVIYKPDGSLEIRPLHYERERAKISFRIGREAKKGLVERLLIASYVTGRDSIELLLENYRDVLDEVYRVVEKIKELEVVEERRVDNTIKLVLSSVVRATRYETSRFIKRMCDLIQTMLSYLIVALDTGDKEQLEEISYIESEVDAIYLRSLRGVFEIAQGKATPEDLSGCALSDLSAYLAIIVFFEIIADHIYLIASKTSSIDLKELSMRKGFSDIKKLLQEYLFLIEIISKTIFLGDVKAANEALNRISALMERTKSLKQEDFKEFQGWIQEFTLRFSSMTDFIKVVAEIALDLAVNKARTATAGEKVGPDLAETG